MSNRATIRIHPQEITGRISPYLTGACMEDVNHEVYGGIYSQMIFGESFSEEPQEIDAARNPAFAGLSGTVSCRAERTWLKDESDVRSWQPFRKGSAEGSFQHTILRARRGRHSQRIEFLRGEGEVGIENRGLNRWGLHLVAGKPYEGQIVLLAAAGVQVAVALETGNGEHVLAETLLAVPGDRQWHTLSFALTPAASDGAGRFAVKLQQPGAVWVDYVLLQPGPWGRFKGTAARKDIAEGLVAEGLTVLRHGGCMINTDWENEPRCPGSGYRWKKMIGPRPDRPPYLGTFYPYNSNGFGIIDFVALCEAAEFLCIPAINPSESPEDVADLVEYLNGAADTPWGARRAADGHPEPYRLRYLEIGNEEHQRDGQQWIHIRSDYPEKFAALVEAASSRDPALTLIAAPWLVNAEATAREENLPLVRRLLEAARGHKVLFDVHVGGDELIDGDKVETDIPALRAFLDRIDPQNQVRFAILEENGDRHDVQRALGHAHIVNTVERLGGQVLIDCPANCLQAWRQNDNSWDQGQLFYTPGQVWGMPPYHAQQMIARHYQPLGVRAEVEGTGLDVSATRSEDGRTVVVKIVSLEAAEQTVAIDPGDAVAAGAVHVTTLTGPLDGENTPEAPERYAPVERTQAWSGGGFEYVAPGYSFTVVEFGLK